MTLYITASEVTTEELEIIETSAVELEMSMAAEMLEINLQAGHACVIWNTISE